jgi:hypothetical protein
MDLEQRLRDSLAAREAPPDFESTVMARVQRMKQGSARARRLAFAWQAPAAIAATVFAAAVGIHWYGEQQRLAHDREQLMLALAITSHELNQVQQRLLRTDSIRIEENGT